MLEMEVLDFKWRVIPYEIREASWHMAVDHALLESMDKKLECGEKVYPVLRTYGFSNDAIVLGHEQNGTRFTNLNGCHFTMRVSGGSHIYFTPRDIHFCIVLPSNLLPEDLIESYRMLNAPVVKTLREFGFNARLGRTSIKVDKEGEKTLAGTAQRSMRYSTLQHGSLLVNDYDEHVFNMLKSSREEKIVWKEKVVTLSALNGEINAANMARRIAVNYAGSDHKESALTIEEKELTERLHKTVYSNRDVIGKGPKEREHICILEGLMTKDYRQHLQENSGI